MKIFKEKFVDSLQFAAELCNLQVDAKNVREVLGMDDETRARRVLGRFTKEIRWAAHLVASMFPATIDYEDALQEARLLILTYAGLTTSGWNNGLLAQIESQTNGNEDEIHRLVAKELRVNLSQEIGRRLDPVVMTSLEPLLGTKFEPSDEHDQMEDRVIKRVDFKAELPRLRTEYPYLVAHEIDGLTESEIADALGVTHQTVHYHIKHEAERAQNEPYFWPLDNDGIPVDSRRTGEYGLVA